MKIPDNDLVLVERFEDLRTGDRVLVRGCRWCGKDEVGLLGNKVPAILHRVGEPFWLGDAFLFLVSACDTPNPPGVSARTVRERRVFRFREDVEVQKPVSTRVPEPVT